MADGFEYQFDFTTNYALDSLQQMSEHAIARYELNDSTAYLWWSCLDSESESDSGHQN